MQTTVLGGTRRRWRRVLVLPRRALHYKIERVVHGVRARDMYAVVADVPHYSEFVPYCEMSRVVQKSADGRELLADMSIGFSRFSERYRSHVILEQSPPTRYCVEARAVDSTLFSKMRTRWELECRSGTDTNVSFDIDLEPASVMHRIALRYVFKDVAEKQLGAFVNRCLRLFPRKPEPPVTEGVLSDEQAFEDFQASVRTALFPLKHQCSLSFADFRVYRRCLALAEKPVGSLEQFRSVCSLVVEEFHRKSLVARHEYDVARMVAENDFIASHVWTCFGPEERVNAATLLSYLYLITKASPLEWLFACMKDCSLNDGECLQRITNDYFRLRIGIIRAALPDLLVDGMASDAFSARQATRDPMIVLGVYGAMESVLQQYEQELLLASGDVASRMAASESPCIDAWALSWSHHVAAVENLSTHNVVLCLRRLISTIASSHVSSY
ncbi:Coenzyme Q-binding protein COQ10 START domain-containing protein [Plasmodiophora brassicae]